ESESACNDERSRRNGGARGRGSSRDGAPGGNGRGGRKLAGTARRERDVLVGAASAKREAAAGSDHACAGEVERTVQVLIAGEAKSTADHQCARRGGGAGSLGGG